MMVSVCLHRCVRDSVLVALGCPHFKAPGPHDVDEGGRKEHRVDLHSGDVAWLLISCVCVGGSVAH